VQIEYSTDELVHYITTNNLPGVYARLVTEGRVNAALPPHVDAVSYAIQEQSGRMSPGEFLRWLEQLMDVPVDPSKPYAAELTHIRQTTGRTPARMLVDQIRQTMPENPAGGGRGNACRCPSGRCHGGGRGDGKRRPYLAWIVLALAVVGLVCVLRYLGRLLGRAVA
jgi:hypothetical protein